MKVVLFFFALTIVVAVVSSTRCGNNEEFSECHSHCPPTCTDPGTRPCIASCKVGCDCKQGFLRNSNGQCVSRNKC
ncbi:hypothetical protein FQR65_LT08545 [Abscondita terminalis]|nr:hypothetical protein FQR65_LT08545 [Abscondita terminalis]